MPIVETMLEAKAGAITPPSTPAVFGAADQRIWESVRSYRQYCNLPIQVPLGKSQGGSCGNQWPLPWEEWN